MRKPGYTFIELVVVTALLALLATFTIPTFQLLLSQFELTTSVGQVGDLLRLSEQRTVSEQKVYYVSLVTGGQTLTQYLQTTPSDQSVGTLVLPSAIVVESLTFGTAQSLYSVKFTTAGAPQVSGTVVLHDTVRDRRRTVVVTPSGAINTSGPEY